MIKLKYFKESDFAKPDEMDSNLLLELDALRDYLGSPIIITSSNSGLHCQASYHYQNIAVDIMAPGYIGGLFNLYLIAERFQFTGIGIYPGWQVNNKITGGLHLDRRPVTSHGRWIGIKNNGKTEYMALTEETLKKYGVLR